MLPMEMGTIVARAFEPTGDVVASDLAADINWEIYGATEDAELYVLLA